MKVLVVAMILGMSMTASAGQIIKLKVPYVSSVGTTTEQQDANKAAKEKFAADQVDKLHATYKQVDLIGLDFETKASTATQVTEELKIKAWVN